MKNVVKVRDIIIGEGIPKICVPIMGKNDEELFQMLKGIKEVDVQIVEWRVDSYEEIHNREAIYSTMNKLRTTVENIPILATFRTKKEGGYKNISVEEYVKLNKWIIESGCIDLIDVEVYTGDLIVKEIIEFAHKKSVKVVLSNHDFEKTPQKDDIISRLCKMQELDGDICKIAVMPNNPKDVLTLLDATYEMKSQYSNRPIVTMSMSAIGGVSRMVGEVFGSAITFGAMGKTSAPGQFPVEELSRGLKMFNINE